MNTYPSNERLREVIRSHEYVTRSNDEVTRCNDLVKR